MQSACSFKRVSLNRLGSVFVSSIGNSANAACQQCRRLSAPKEVGQFPQLGLKLLANQRNSTC